MHQLVWPAVVVAFVAIIVRSVSLASKHVNDGPFLGHLKKLFFARNADRAAKLLDAAETTVLGASLRALFLRSKQDDDVAAWKRAFDETFARKARPLVISAPIVVAFLLVALGAIVADAVDTGGFDPAPVVAVGSAILIAASLARNEIRLFRRAAKNRDAFAQLLRETRE